MKVIGRKKSSFIAQEGDLKGQLIEGLNLFCTYPITKDGDGLGVKKIFLSANKLSRLEYVPELDDEIEVLYNQYRKVEKIVAVCKDGDGDDDGELTF